MTNDLGQLELQSGSSHQRIMSAGARLERGELYPEASDVMKEKLGGKMFEKGIFLKMCSLSLISFSDCHRKRQDFSHYRSLELHPKLNGLIISMTKGI